MRSKDSRLSLHRLHSSHIPPSFLSIGLATYLWCARPSIGAEGDDSLAYKFQFYGEEDGRIEILSHYALWEQHLPYDISFSVKLLADIITGATPTGLRNPDRATGADPNGEKITYSEIEDERYAGVFVLSKKFEGNTISFEYARSEEGDYISNGYAVRSLHEFNGKNTTLSLGLGYNDDTVEPDFFDKPEKKESLDFSIGLSQILDPKTVVRGAFSLGYSRGYLNDPYKRISRLELIELEDLDPFFEDQAYSENRPDERLRLAIALGLTHYWEALRAGMDLSYRLFWDDAGLSSHTLQLEWNQKLGEKFVLSPYYRFYHQSAADYYHPHLDNVSFTPNSEPTGSAPYYSSDYRLASLDAHAYGVRLAYFPSNWLTVDLAYERYDMFGNDSVTPAANFPRADIVTFGVKATF